jgi:nucleoside-diphosphate-sugar epimerase
VAHLAAIVGDPACAKTPELALETNLKATQAFYEIANAAKIQKFVFASTCSNYGKMNNEAEFVTENSKLAPVSLYAETKVNAENYLLQVPKENICKPTCLRFSTVYGLSPRMRFDLTVNEFTKNVALKQKLVIYGEQFWRPYCHVNDLAASVELVMGSEEAKTAFEVFNVGDTSENYQKKGIAEEIQKQMPDAQINYVTSTEDPRDYRVNFDKITRTLNFKISRTIPDGIREIKQAVQAGFFINTEDAKFKNT